MVSLVLQGLWTLSLLVLAAYSMVLSVRHQRFARDYRSLSLFLVALGLLGVIGWFGLSRRKLWGWGLACICSWGLAAEFVCHFIDIVTINGWSVVDWGFAVSTASSLILPIWLVMPGTRKFYWNHTSFSDA